MSVSWSTKPVSDKFTIGVISLDGEEILDSYHIKAALSSYYLAEVIILAPIKGSNEIYWNHSDTLNPGRAIDFLEKMQFTDSIDLIMGITEDPMFLGGSSPFWKKNGFIRGLGIRDGEYCVISTSNIKKITGDYSDLYIKMLQQVSRHEIGHNLGLAHCETEARCAMVGSFDTNVLLEARPTFCDSCASIINEYLNL